MDMPLKTRHSTPCRGPFCSLLFLWVFHWIDEDLREDRGYETGERYIHICVGHNRSNIILENNGGAAVLKNVPLSSPNSHVPMSRNLQEDLTASFLGTRRSRITALV